MEPDEIAKYRESQSQWLIDALSRRQELSVQIAMLDNEISIVRKVLRSYDNLEPQSSAKDGEP
jgi:hypothetical protein